MRTRSIGVSVIDQETDEDMTSWSFSVKRPGKGHWYLKGMFCNLFLDKAFDEKNKKERDAAIAIVKDQLWYAFKKCYLEKV